MEVRSVLDLWMERTKETESPSIFHKWIAIAVAGHILGRRVWVSKAGEYPLFPAQMMVCLVARSAELRKSTAVNVGGRTLNAIAERLPGKGLVNRIAEQGSPQSFLDQLQVKDEMDLVIEGADAIGIVVATELGAFLSKESHNEVLATYMTALNDAPHGEFNEETLEFGPYVWRSKYMTRPGFALRNPCVGMIAATTPTGLAKEIPHQAQLTGFFGRVIWVYADETDKEPNPMTGLRPKVAGQQRELVDRLVAMTGLAGPVRYKKEARAYYDEWYKTHRKEHVKTDGTLTSGFRQRKHDHVLRVAMVLAAMDGSLSQRNGGIVLQVPHIKEGVRLLTQVERELPRCFMEIQVRSLHNLGTLILRMLSRHRERWFDRHSIIKRMWNYKYNARECDDALAQLHQVSQVRKRGQAVAAEYRFRESAGAMLRLAKESEDEGGEEES